MVSHREGPRGRGPRQRTSRGRKVGGSEGRMVGGRVGAPAVAEPMAGKPRRPGSMHSDWFHTTTRRIGFPNLSILGLTSCPLPWSSVAEDLVVCQNSDPSGLVSHDEGPAGPRQRRDGRKPDQTKAGLLAICSAVRQKPGGPRLWGGSPGEDHPGGEVGRVILNPPVRRGRSQTRRVKDNAPYQWDLPAISNRGRVVDPALPWISNPGRRGAPALPNNQSRITGSRSARRAGLTFGVAPR
jgi:hypothetical protein